MGCFIVAEAGVNHGGTLARMLAYCDAAKKTGADAVKFQAFNAAALIERRGITDEATCALLRQTEITDHQLEVIADHCLREGIKWFASVFDPSQVARVLRYGACALKIGHAESGWRELVFTAVNQAALVPVYVSNPVLTGGIAVHCIEEYPAKSPPRLHLCGKRNGLGWDSLGHKLEQEYPGFSSHYADWRIPAAAALRGACYIEAHLKLDNDCREAAWSLDVTDFRDMVTQIREYETWL